MSTDRPKPVQTVEARPFWDAAAEGQLVFQFCTQCERAQFYPRVLCSHCGSKAVEWRKSSGLATVHAATRIHTGLPSFKADVPYNVVLVDVAEGFRMLMNVVGNPPDVGIGDRGRVVFETRDGVALPQFERTKPLPTAFAGGQ
jgi:uncharacterized OB-fold protein